MHELDAVQRTANIIVFMIWQWKKYNLFTQKKSNQFRLATFLGFNSKPSFACKYIIRIKLFCNVFPRIQVCIILRICYWLVMVCHTWYLVRRYLMYIKNAFIQSNYEKITASDSSSWTSKCCWEPQHDRTIFGMSFYKVKLTIIKFLIGKYFQKHLLIKYDLLRV